MRQNVKSRSNSSKLVSVAEDIEDDGQHRSKPLWNQIKANVKPDMIVLSLIFLVSVSLLGFALFQLLFGDHLAMKSFGATKKNQKLVVPECEAQPWKPEEDLVGECGNSLESHKLTTHKLTSLDESISDQTRIEACANECCASKDCIAWQYRRDIGCMHGGDVRLGMEKDGPGSWCHEHPPKRWSGQYKKDDNGACDSNKWNPNEQPGQCFGLGDKRKGIDSSEQCRDACCNDTSCGAWQFHADLGCFYNKDMYGCKDVTSNPHMLEPFVGRRKKLSDRKYEDNEGKPWSQQLQ